MRVHSSALCVGLELQPSNLLRQSIMFQFYCLIFIIIVINLAVMIAQIPTYFNFPIISNSHRTCLCLLVSKRIAIQLLMKSRKYLNNMFCPQHPQEKLNLICVQSTCLCRGLICQQCRVEQSQTHINHSDSIIPFKYFVESLENSLDDKEVELSGITEQSCLSKLQKLRDETLARLSLTIQEVARYVSEVEAKIIHDYEASKEKIMQRSLLYRQSKSCIERCVIHNIRKEEKFELMAQMKKIVKYARPVKSKNGGFQFRLEISGKNIIADTIEQSEYHKLSCQRLQIQLKNIFGAKKGQEKNSIYQRYQEQIKKRELSLIEEENKNIVESKKKEEKLRLMKIQKEKLMKKMLEKEEKKEKKKEEQEKKNKKEPIEEKIPLQLLTALSKEEWEAVNQKKPPKISFADFAETQMKLDESSKKDTAKGQIFSSLFKGISIKVLKQGRAVKQTSSQQPVTGFAILSEALQKCRKLSMKIVKIKAQIFIGIARHESIAAKKYTFQGITQYLVTPNHGTFLVNNKGLTYSSSFAPDNKHHHNFAFEEADIINLIFDQGKLIVERHPSKKSPLYEKTQELILKTDVIQVETRNYNFCVFLGGIGDSVEII